MIYLPALQALVETVGDEELTPPLPLLTYCPETPQFHFNKACAHT